MNLDPSKIMQDSEFEMFCMEEDLEVDKETVYEDIELVSDFIMSPDLIQTNSMRQSTSVPITPVPFPFHLTSDVSNESQVHSLPRTFDHLPDFREYVDPSWTVPALQYSSYGTAADAETCFNDLVSDPPVYGAIVPSPELGLSSFLRPLSIQQYFPSGSTMSRAESNASFDSTHDEDYDPTAVERFNNSPNPPGNHAFALVHREPGRRNKRSSPGPGVEKKSSRGRKGPLKLNERLSTSEMRKVGACQACRDRKTKVEKIGLLFRHYID